MGAAIVKTDEMDAPLGKARPRNPPAPSGSGWVPDGNGYPDLIAVATQPRVRASERRSIASQASPASGPTGPRRQGRVKIASGSARLLPVRPRCGYTAANVNVTWLSVRWNPGIDRPWRLIFFSLPNVPSSAPSPETSGRLKPPSPFSHSPPTWSNRTPTPFRQADNPSPNTHTHTHTHTHARIQAAVVGLGTLVLRCPPPPPTAKL